VPKIKTIGELKKEIAAKERALKKLRTKRAKLGAAIAALDKRIAMLLGATTAAPAKAKRRRPKKVTKRGRKKATRLGRPKKAAKRGRPKGKRKGQPLPESLKKVLAKAPDGMRTKDIAVAVKKAGYKSKSKNFNQIVASTLPKIKGIKRVGRGVYKLSK